MNNEIKKDVSKVSIGSLLYCIIMIFVVMIVSIIQASIEVFKVKDASSVFDSDEFANKILNSGTSSIIAVIFGVAFLCLFFNKLGISKIFKENKSMNIKSFLQLTVCFIAVQIIFSVGSYAVEGGLNSIGYTMQGDIDSASSISTTVSMFLYASIIGPITEEIVFRGFILRKLEKHGKILSIVISAILFGAFHMNLIQGIFAFLVGIILGYVAIEYSIKWSMLLHIINNLVFGDLLGYMVSRFSESTQNIIVTLIELLFFIGGLILVIKNREKIKLYIKENKTQNFKIAFCSVGFIICMSIMLIVSLSGISRI